MDRRVFFGMLLVFCLYEISESRSLIERLASVVNRDADPDFHCDDLVSAMERALNVAALDFSLNAGSHVTLRTLAIHVTGIDVFVHSELQRTVCRITDATTVAQLLDIYTELGILESALEFGYGVGTAYLPVFITEMEDSLNNGGGNGPLRPMIEASIDILHQIQDEHLDTLHPDATAFACSIAPFVFQCGGVQESKRSYYKKRGHVVKRTASCERLYGNIETLVQALDNFGSQVAEAIKNQVLGMTGINLNNETQVREFACAVLDITSVGDLLNLMNREGVTQRLFNVVYESMAAMPRQGRAGCEYVIQLWEQGNEDMEEHALKCQNVYLPYFDVCEQSGLLDLQ